SLGTVGTQTLTISDQSNGSILSMTSSPIVVVPSNIDHFAVSAISSPQTAGVPVTVTIRGTDASGNTVPNYNGDVLLIPNTGAGSLTPASITLASGTWTGPLTFKGAGGAVSFAVADFSSPPHTGQSNSFAVQPGPFTGLQVLLPGESPQGGTASGKSGVPTNQQAGPPVTLTGRAGEA